MRGKSTRAVGPELRAKVLDATARLSRTANPHARAGWTSPDSLVHDLAGPYFSSIVASVTRAAEEQGAIVVLGTTFREIEYAATQRARAIVLRMTSRLGAAPGRPGGVRRPGRTERPHGASRRAPTGLGQDARP